MPPKNLEPINFKDLSSLPHAISIRTGYFGYKMERSRFLYTGFYCIWCEFIMYMYMVYLLTQVKLRQHIADVDLQIINLMLPNITLPVMTV